MQPQNTGTDVYNQARQQAVPERIRNGLSTIRLISGAVPLLGVLRLQNLHEMHHRLSDMHQACPGVVFLVQ